MSKYQIIIFLFIILKTSNTIANPRDTSSFILKGQVVSETGPIPGATVQIKSTPLGMQTDTDGNFQIKATIGQTLVVQYLGYTKQEVPIQTTKILKVILTKTVNQLDETIVIGYGKSNRRLSTASISKITAKNISSQPVSNFIGTLEGIPGLITTQGSGISGSSYKVQIRGQNSITQGSQPLIVIDNIPFGPGNDSYNQIVSAANVSGAGSAGGLSPFDLINPDEIESIEVLKDADATSIYGSRGANGVILITTKKGKKGKARFSVSAYTGQSRVTRSMRSLNTSEYLQMRKEAFKNDAANPTNSRAYDILLWDTTRYTDLRKLLIGSTASTNDVNTSYSAGNENTQFLVTTGYHKETQVFPGNFSDRRLSSSLSLTHTTTDKNLIIDVSVRYSNSNNTLPQRDLTAYINKLPPNVLLYDSTGKLNWQEKGYKFDNPLSYLLQDYSMRSDNLQANTTVNYKLMRNLKVTLNAGFGAFNSTEEAVTPIAAQNPNNTIFGQLQQGNASNRNWIIEPQAEYSIRIKNHAITTLIGGTWQQTTSASTNIIAGGYTNDALLHSLSAAGSIITTNGNTVYKYQAAFARINYNYADKYVLNFSGRRDGSSRFGINNQYANFMAIGGAWIFSNETWFNSFFPALSYGKLRGSYGTTGNDQIGDYKFLDTWKATDLKYGGIGGTIPDHLLNPNFAWESNKKADIAMELGILKNNLLIGFDYYSNKSTNQLIDYLLPNQTGFPTVLQNSPAVVRNTGWEATIDYKLQLRKVDWTFSANVSVPKNKLLSFPGLQNSSYGNKYAIGQSLNVVRGYIYNGVDPKTGVYQFKDQNNDGQLTYLDDYRTIGNLDPKFIASLRNNVKYKNIELSFLITYKKQTGRNYMAFMSSYIPGRNYNQPEAVMNRWTKEGSAEIQKFTQQAGTAAYTAAYQYLQASSAVFSDASYLRLRNVSVSYTLPNRLLSKIHADGLRAYCNMQNLLTITSYKGGDPETQNINVLPPLRTIVLGIQLTL